ncbi:MAG: HEAT repeat domain-containing protein [Candidatus Omnitrophica bacterium]|nr:HEAT repeat domain-containing protein [Candidatus Omnitrophota bacterium]
MPDDLSTEQPESEEKSFLRVIVHSFFIIPFLIAVFGVLLFAGMRLLTQEKHSAYDYLNDIKVGGFSKRWQGALELSKMLSNPALIPDEERFDNELIAAFQAARHDDNRVRQYLALAMGRTQRPVYGDILVSGLAEEKEDNIPALVYAIGMIGIPDNAPALHGFLEHGNARVRSIAAVSLGHLQNSASIPFLKKGLQDPEPNVQWGSAVSLAKMGDLSGKPILLKLLSRDYLDQFKEVDQLEQNDLIIAAINAGGRPKDPELKTRIQELATQDKNMNVRAAALKALNSQ